MSNTNENKIFAFTIVSPVEGLSISYVIFLFILNWKEKEFIPCVF